MLIADYLALPLETQRNILKEKLCETVPRGEIKEAAHAAGLSDYTLYKARKDALLCGSEGQWFLVWP